MATPTHRQTFPLPFNSPRASASFATTYKPPRDCCFKVFVVATLVLATVALIFGILTVCACKGCFDGVVTMGHLVRIGEVNGFVMAIGGLILVVASLLAWSCHVRRENDRFSRHLPSTPSPSPFSSPVKTSYV